MIKIYLYLLLVYKPTLYFGAIGASACIFSYFLVFLHFFLFLFLRKNFYKRSSFLVPHRYLLFILIACFTTCLICAGYREFKIPDYFPVEHSWHREKRIHSVPNNYYHSYRVNKNYKVLADIIQNHVDTMGPWDSSTRINLEKGESFFLDFYFGIFLPQVLNTPSQDKAIGINYGFYGDGKRFFKARVTYITPELSLVELAIYYRGGD